MALLRYPSPGSKMHRGLLNSEAPSTTPTTTSNNATPDALSIYFGHFDQGMSTIPLSPSTRVQSPEAIPDSWEDDDAYEEEAQTSEFIASPDSLTRQESSSAGDCLISSEGLTPISNFSIDDLEVTERPDVSVAEGKSPEVTERPDVSVMEGTPLEVTERPDVSAAEGKTVIDFSKPIDWGDSDDDDDYVAPASMFKTPVVENKKVEIDFENKSFDWDESDDDDYVAPPPMFAKAPAAAVSARPDVADDDSELESECEPIPFPPRRTPFITNYNEMARQFGLRAPLWARAISTRPLFFEDDAELQHTPYYRRHEYTEELYRVTSWTGMEDILCRVARECAGDSGLSGGAFAAPCKPRRMSDRSEFFAAQRKRLLDDFNVVVPEPVHVQSNNDILEDDDIDERFQPLHQKVVPRPPLPLAFTGNGKKLSSAQPVSRSPLFLRDDPSDAVWCKLCQDYNIQVVLGLNHTDHSISTRRNIFAHAGIEEKAIPWLEIQDEDAPAWQPLGTPSNPYGDRPELLQERTSAAQYIDMLERAPDYELMDPELMAYILYDESEQQTLARWGQYADHARSVLIWQLSVQANEGLEEPTCMEQPVLKVYEPLTRLGSCESYSEESISESGSDEVEEEVVFEEDTATIVESAPLEEETLFNAGIILTRDEPEAETKVEADVAMEVEAHQAETDVKVEVQKEAVRQPVLERLDTLGIDDDSDDDDDYDSDDDLEAIDDLSAGSSKEDPQMGYFSLCNDRLSRVRKLAASDKFAHLSLSESVSTPMKTRDEEATKPNSGSTLLGVYQSLSSRIAGWLGS